MEQLSILVAVMSVAFGGLAWYEFMYGADPFEDEDEDEQS